MKLLEAEAAAGHKAQLSPNAASHTKNQCFTGAVKSQTAIQTAAPCGIIEIRNSGAGCRKQRIYVKTDHPENHAFIQDVSMRDELQGESGSISTRSVSLQSLRKAERLFNLRWYTDDGCSGANFQRPGFQSMLADIEAGKVATVIVKDMSQLGRNYLRVGMYTEMIFPQKSPLYRHQRWSRQRTGRQ